MAFVRVLTKRKCYLVALIRAIYMKNDVTVKWRVTCNCCLFYAAVVKFNSLCVMMTWCLVPRPFMMTCDGEQVVIVGRS